MLTIVEPTYIRILTVAIKLVLVSKFTTHNIEKINKNQDAWKEREKYFTWFDFVAYTNKHDGEAFTIDLKDYYNSFRHS